MVDTSVVTSHRTAVGQTMVASSFTIIAKVLLVQKLTVDTNLLGSTPLAFVKDTPCSAAYLGEVSSD